MLPTSGIRQGFSAGVPRDVVRGSARDRGWKKEKLKFPLPALLTCIRVDILCGEEEPHKKSRLISWPK
jgi:hypothetical protein